MLSIFASKITKNTEKPVQLGVATAIDFVRFHGHRQQFCSGCMAMGFPFYRYIICIIMAKIRMDGFHTQINL